MAAAAPGTMFIFRVKRKQEKVQHQMHMHFISEKNKNIFWMLMSHGPEGVMLQGKLVVSVFHVSASMEESEGRGEAGNGVELVGRQHLPHFFILDPASTALIFFF